ncbi:hypothetical protein MPSEU_000749700 [Mayamaea pseudoterrestris]|nr:hypothetical protein MPSEU_000749700 [Mayamaea pseudoterrestris]
MADCQWPQLHRAMLVHDAKATINSKQQKLYTLFHALMEDDDNNAQRDGGRTISFCNHVRHQNTVGRGHETGRCKWFRSIHALGLIEWIHCRRVCRQWRAADSWLSHFC